MSCSFLLRICQPSTATCRCCITELWLSDSQRATELCPTSSNTTCQSWTPLRRFWRIFPTENLGNPHPSRDVVLLMRRSPLSLLCRENLPRLHLLCSIFGSLSPFLCFNVSRLRLMMDDASLVIWGALGGLVLPVDSGQSRSFAMRRSLNSSWETNEDKFGGRMYFCIEGVLGPICSSVTLTWSSVLFFFGLSLVFLLIPSLYICPQHEHWPIYQHQTCVRCGDI